MSKFSSPSRGANRPEKVSVRAAARRALQADSAARKTAVKSVKNVAAQNNIKSAQRVTDFMSSDSFQNFALSLGLGTENALSASTYGFFPITRQRITLEWIHRGSWLGGVAVDLVADDMTRAGAELKGELKPAQIDEINENIDGLGVWEAINDCVKWSRLYGGCIAVMQIVGQKLSTPLRLETIGKDQFKGLAVFDRWMVEPSLNDLVTDPGPSRGLPKYYQVIADAPMMPGEKVHYSRCLRLEGSRLPYYQRLMENLWGVSVIERIYDRMIAFDSATQGAAQLVHKSFLRTLKLKGMRQALAAGGKAEQGLVKQVHMMRLMQQNEGISIIDADDEFQLDQSSGYAGISDIILRFGEQLSGALQIPLVRLFGQSPAGLSSTGESDLRTYYDGIKQQQNRYLKLPMLRVFRAQAQSLGIKVPDGFGMEFRSLWQLTEKERAETAQVMGAAVDTALASRTLSRANAMKELKQSSIITGIFSNISDEDIAEAKKEDDLLPPPGPEDPAALAEASGEGRRAATAAEEGENTPSGTPNAAPRKFGATKPAEKPAEGEPEAKVPAKQPASSDSAYPHFDGIDTVIETRKGEPRAPWGTTMPAHYGYLRGTGSGEGPDEQMDCFLGDAPGSKKVWVVHQRDLSTNEFDEHKCMLGFDTASQALDCYVKAFGENGRGQDRIMRVDAMTLERFKDWLKGFPYSLSSEVAAS